MSSPGGAAEAEVVPLWPQPGPPRALRGLYLELRLHERGGRARPFVYGSFVASLDGRIATEGGHDRGDPLDGLKSRTDFRLFRELHAQADCVITHGGYLRALAAGQLGNMLRVDAASGAADLLAWRDATGLPQQPAIAIASRSLDFPLPTPWLTSGQRWYVATVSDAEPRRVRALEQAGAEVWIAGERRVEGDRLAAALGARGHRSLYLLAGPMLLESMLRHRRLDRLFLTLRHRLLGGETFHTMIAGPRLGSEGDLALCSLHLDPEGGQLFAELAPMHDTGAASCDARARCYDPPPS
jgi:riboflavin biosynthesis pyrimidine reductase